MSKQQTAINYLVEQFARYYSIHQLDEEIDQAKAMEKERIMNAWASGVLSDDNMTAEQYYNKTYKSE